MAEDTEDTTTEKTFRRGLNGPFVEMDFREWNRAKTEAQKSNFDSLSPAVCPKYGVGIRNRKAVMIKRNTKTMSYDIKIIEEARINSYRSFPLSSNNTLLLTPAFSRGSSQEGAEEKINDLIDAILKLTGVKEQKTVWFGYWFLKPSPHAHILLYSTKDFKTGASVARISAEDKAFLNDWWKEILAGESVLIKRIWCLDNVLDYFAGKKNLGRRGQEWFVIEKNLELLQAKMKKAA